MSPIVHKLDERLRRWNPEIAREVEGILEEVIELADADSLDLLRSREVEQEVLDLIDEDQAR